MKVVTIGRLPDNNIVIEDFSISRHHAQIIQHDGGRLTLLDMQSGNGIYVNGQRVNGFVDLHYGDEVKIGNITLNWEKYFLTKSLKDISNEPSDQPPYDNAMCYCPAPPDSSRQPGNSKWIVWLIIILVLMPLLVWFGLWLYFYVL